MAKKIEEPRVKVVEDEPRALVLSKPREVAKRARQAAGVSVNPESLLLAAVKGKASPEVMRAAMDVRRELVQEQARREYYDALTAFQSELKPIIKTKVVKNKQERVDAGEVDEVRFRYAQIEKIVKEIQKLCDKYGFSHDFDTGEIKEHVVTVTCIIHHVGGHETRHTFPSPVIFEQGAKLGQSPAQVVNGAITFGRRVSLIEGYGIMTADPDPEGPQPEGEGDIQEPKAVAEERAAKSAPKKKGANLDMVMEEVVALIEQKAQGPAAKRFIQTAHEHYDKGRSDLLAALRDSLKKMKQGVAK